MVKSWRLSCAPETSGITRMPCTSVSNPIFDKNLQFNYALSVNRCSYGEYNVVGMLTTISLCILKLASNRTKETRYTFHKSSDKETNHRKIEWGGGFAVIRIIAGAKTPRMRGGCKRG